MNNQSWRIERLKYCRIENTPDGVKYYGVVGKELIEVSKDVYHVLERSYHKEWKMDLDRNRENHISYDQLAEEIASADYHNTVPPSLQYRSTEEEYFDEEDPAHRVSLGGCSPVALQRYLIDHPEIEYVNLGLDNDEQGRNAAENIKEMLKDSYKVYDHTPTFGKDFNEDLMHRQEQYRESHKEKDDPEPER